MVDPESGDFGRGVSKIGPIKMHLKHQLALIIRVWISSTTWMRQRRVFAFPIRTTQSRVEMK